MRGVDRQRRHHRIDPLPELEIHVVAVLFIEVAVVGEADSRRRQARGDVGYEDLAGPFVVPLGDRPHSFEGLDRA